MRTPSVLLSVCLLALPAAAQCEIVRLEAQPSFGALNRGDLDGDTLALSGDGDRFVVLERGPAGWLQTASVELDVFWVFEPLRVALDGGRLAVAASEHGPTFDDLQGSVWVYDRDDDWGVPRRVVPDVPAAEDFFGRALDLAGDVLVVGAPQQNAWLGNGPGHALVFEFDGARWAQVADLHPHTQGGSSLAQYATTVATDGSTVVVGAWQDQQAGQFTGAAYVYERVAGAWVEVVKLLAPQPSGVGTFGYSVAVEGSTLVVCDTTQVHVYERAPQGWLPSQVLAPVEPTWTGAFGLSVALDGDDLVVGAPSTDVPFGPNNVGALHVYRRGPSGWAPAAALLADDAPTNAWLGRSVAVSGGAALWAGDLPEARLLDLGLGRVVQVCAGGASSTGAPATLSADGCDSLLANGLTLGLSGAPANEASWLRVSTTTVSTPFGNGTLCLGAPSTLLAAGVTDAQGAWSVAPDLSAPPFDAWAPGDTAYCQAGFRDPGFGAGHGTSDALGLALQP